MRASRRATAARGRRFARSRSAGLPATRRRCGRAGRRVCGALDLDATALARRRARAAKPPWRPAEVRATIISVPVARRPWFGAFDE